MKRVTPRIIAFAAVGVLLVVACIFLFLRTPDKNTVIQDSPPVSSSNADEIPSFPKPPVKDNTVVTPETWDSVIVSEHQSTDEKPKFDKIDFTNRLATPKYDTKLRLYISTSDEKPSKFPWEGNKTTLQEDPSQNLINQRGGTTKINPNIIKPNLPVAPAYSDVPYNCFIDWEGSKKGYFAFKLDTKEVSKVVWQVSKVPFNGSPNNWQRPAGLVASGEISPNTSEFSVDFSKFVQPPQLLSSRFKISPGGKITLGIDSFKEIPKSQRIFYVRAVPVNNNGQCIGDPGEGIGVLYGKPLDNSKALQKIQPSFELWHALRQGQPNTNGEYPNKFVHEPNSIQGFTPQNGASPYWFMVKGYDASVLKIIIQVSTIKFQSNTSDWENPNGMVYSKTYSDLPIRINQSFEGAVSINFMDFGPHPDKIGNKKAVYYIRAVALKRSQMSSGAVEPSFSDVRTVEYCKPKPQVIYDKKDIIVPSNAPKVTFLRYQPTHWEDYEWAHYYTVVRQPKYNEINFMLYNKKTSQVLYPYSMYKMLNPNTTPEYYEKQVVPKFLVPGSGFKVVVKEAEKSWWGELWEGIVDFFKSIGEVIGKVTNWVASTYNNLKSSLINLVASNFPLIPDEWKDELKAALTALVDYGLASMGIPPTLPNFEELSEQGLDYAIRVAMQESGIPVNEITQAAVNEAKGIVIDQIKQASNTPGPNPLKSPFIKNDPFYMYKPAYIDLFIENKDSESTPTGSINVIINSEKWPYYPVFEPVSQAIPALNRGEHTTVRIYLKEWVNKPYPGGAIAIKEDFTNMYWGKDGQQTEFNIYIKYNLPSAKDAAHALELDKNLSENCIYTYRYDNEYMNISFKNIPCNSYIK